WPPSTFTANFVVQPASGAFARPSSRPMVQLCSGQATLSPNTMPWLKGAPLCGQRSSSANTLSSALRNTATAQALARCTRRAPSTGMSSTRQMGVQSLMISVPASSGDRQPRIHPGHPVHCLQHVLTGADHFGGAAQALAGRVALLQRVLEEHPLVL